MASEAATASDVVDAHLHYWDLGARPQPWIDPIAMPMLHRSFLPTEMLTEIEQAGVAGAVLVQVFNDADETADFLALAATTSLVLGVVGWTDLSAHDVADTIDALRAGPGGDCLVGIRHQSLAEPDPLGWLSSPDVVRGFGALQRQGLVAELMFADVHLAALPEALDGLPEMPLVVDHAAKPPIATGWRSAQSRRWAAGIVEVARRPHVLCKLSGLTVMASARWTPADLQPFVDHLLEVFGTSRLLFGSDWPVSTRAGSYAETLSATSAVLTALSHDDRTRITGGTARATYGLAAAATRHDEEAT